MLNSLLNDLTASGEHHISVLLDYRCLNVCLPESVTVIPVAQNDDVLAVFNNALQHCDAVLPIAPETGRILLNITRLIEASGKLLLSSTANAVANTSDKLQTFNILASQGIKTITTYGLHQYQYFFTQGTVVKARDGVGCENCFFIDNEDDFNQLLARLDNWQDYIIQPFVLGDNLSISAIFNNGTGQIICINRQQLEIHHQSVKLLGCEVNCLTDSGHCQQLLTFIAKAFPGLWGYVGIDIIQHQDQLIVVEINPRLTSSYAGISKALGINVAEQLINLLTTGTAVLTATRNQTVNIQLNTGLLHAN